MQHIKQHNNHSCVIASIAMVTNGVSYRTIKNYCRKHYRYNVTKQSGCYVNHDQIIEYLKSLGHSILLCESGAQGTISKLSRNQKALIFLSSDGGGHAVAWDGCRIFDPTYDKPYTEAMLFKNYDMTKLESSLIVIEETILQRFINKIKMHYYDMLEDL